MRRASSLCPSGGAATGSQVTPSKFQVPGIRSRVGKDALIDLCASTSQSFTLSRSMARLAMLPRDEKYHIRSVKIECREKYSWAQIWPSGRSQRRTYSPSKRLAQTIPVNVRHRSPGIFFLGLYELRGTKLQNCRIAISYQSETEKSWTPVL